MADHDFNRPKRVPFSGPIGAEAVAERDRLRAWKQKALTVIHAWELVGAALEVDKIGPLGESKAAIALREVVRLREVNAELVKACWLAEDYLIRAGHAENDSTRGGVALKAICDAKARSK